MKLVLENREKFLQEELGHLKTFHLKLKADLRASFCTAYASIRVAWAVCGDRVFGSHLCGMSSKSIVGHGKSRRGSGVSFHARLSLRNFKSGKEERRCSGFGTPLCSGQFRPVPPDQRVKQGQCALGSEQALARASIQPFLAPLALISGARAGKQRLL